MRVEVLRSFIDKQTKEVVKKGTIIEDMSEERFAEITESTGYIKKIKSIILVIVVGKLRITLVTVTKASIYINAQIAAPIIPYA